jgi:hypothetical protein
MRLLLALSGHAWPVCGCPLAGREADIDFPEHPTGAAVTTTGRAIV